MCCMPRDPQITSGLKNQAGTDAVVILVKNGCDRQVTNTVILTFNMPQPPQHVTAGYLHIPVAVYISNPLRCCQCQKFGHGRSHCKTPHAVVRVDMMTQNAIRQNTASTVMETMLHPRRLVQNGSFSRGCSRCLTSYHKPTVTTKQSSSYHDQSTCARSQNKKLQNHVKHNVRHQH